MSDEDCGASVRKWTDVIRRAELDPTTKLVALLMASYADADGTNIFPGLPRLAVESGKGYSTVKRVLAWLRRVGLIECVRRPTRECPHAQYRLTLGSQLPGHVKVPSPAEHRRAVESLDEARKSKARPDEPSPTALVDEPSDADADPESRAHSYEPDLEVEGSSGRSVPYTDQLSTTSQEERAPLRAITGGAEMLRTHAPNQPGLWPAAVPDAAPDITAGDTPSVTTAQTIVGEWIDRCAKRPPGRVVGQVAKYVREMLAEGIDPDDIRRGCAAWMTKGLHPAALASVVNEVMNRGTAPAARPSTTDQRVADTLALGARLQAEADRKAVGR